MLRISFGTDTSTIVVTPFGSLTYLKPTPIEMPGLCKKKKTNALRHKAKFVDGSCPGVFFGWKVHTGGRWKDEYLVADLRVFALQDFSVYAKRWVNTTTPIRREIHCPLLDD